MALTIRATLKWNLLLDPTREYKPHLHAYLSTSFSEEVKVLDLGSAQGSTKMTLKFDSDRLRRTSARDLLRGCDLNLDVYVHDKVHQYKEPITNPAGCSIFPLHEILSQLGPHTEGGSLTEPVVLFMVHDDDKRVKGTLTLESIVLAKTTATLAPVLVLNDVGLVEKDLKDASIQAILDRNEKMQHICGRYIEASEVLYEGVEPTIESVSNINSAIWVSRCGIFPPIAYTLDVVKPTISEDFYQNSLDIVLSRLKLTRQYLSGLDLVANKDHIKIMGSVAGQVLCCYIAHCTYRTDYARAFNRKTNQFETVPTENFGDVSVDHGAGDCEDFAKMIIRIYLGLMRFHKKTSDPVLQKVISFLKCYYPFLVLLGVSSAQINAAPKDIQNMGAHENAMLTPLQQFMDELIRFNPRAKVWKEQLMGDPEQREFWERSKNYPDLVLEGTGILEPVIERERAIKLRLVLEEFMEEDVFYALRRSYYYDRKNTSFYKTVEKMFTPVPILEGGSFGSFLIMHKNGKDGRLRKKLTKSVSFSDFIADSHDVAVFMEPELTAAEKVSIFEGMKNIHPPVPLLPPSKDGQKRLKCEALIRQLETRLKPYMRPVSGNSLQQTYYLRSGKVDQTTIDQLFQFFSELPPGLCNQLEFFSEWVTDEVGGYRLVLTADSAAAASHWSAKANYLSKKLPKD